MPMLNATVSGQGAKDCSLSFQAANTRVRYKTLTKVGEASHPQPTRHWLERLEYKSKINLLPSPLSFLV